MSSTGIDRDHLQATWAASATDIWAVGSGSATLHWNGTKWNNVTNPLQAPLVFLSDVWGSSGSDVWAVGSNGTFPETATALRYNGTAWSQVTAGLSGQVGIGAVFGFSSTDVWAIAGSNFLRWNGSTWAVGPAPVTGKYNALWGTAANNLYAVGNAGAIAKWNGTSWAIVPSGNATFNFESIVGRGANDIWAAGATASGFGGAVHYNGSFWAEDSSSGISLTNYLSGLCVVGSTVYLTWADGMFRWTGSDWVSELRDIPLNDCASLPEGEAPLAVGKSMAILRKR